MKILLITDDKDNGDAIHSKLSKWFIVEVMNMGADADYYAHFAGCDIILFNISSRHSNAIEMYKKWRTKGIQTPILLLTYKNNVEEKVVALNAGADDYMTKPFHFDELVARIRTLLRRSDKPLSTTILTIQDLSFDVGTGLVARQGKQILLRRKELHLLEYFMRNIGRIITRQMILNHVWETATECSSNVIDVHMKYLRDHIDKPFEKKLIKTIHGLGYKIE